MKAVQIRQHGGAEVLEVVDAEIREPRAHEVLVRVAAAGVNFIDIYHRTGFYPVSLPFIPGQEAAGTVSVVPTGLKGWTPGDRVAYAGNHASYAEYCIVPAERLVRVPPSIDFKTAAAVMLQGMTAHYLAISTFPLKAGDVCLVHAAAGGVGLLLCQIASMRGATVIGTTSSEAKAARARAAGAQHIILYSRENVAERVRELTHGRGADVVYDSVGKTTFQGSLESLRPRGMLVSFGQSSGAIGAVDPLLFSKGSFFFTRPVLAHYTAERSQLEQRAHDIFEWIAAGKLKVNIDRELPLERAADAHRALESRQTSGKVLLLA